MTTRAGSGAMTTAQTAVLAALLRDVAIVLAVVVYTIDTL
jgi:hypothetical protein